MGLKHKEFFILYAFFVAASLFFRRFPYLCKRMRMQVNISPLNRLFLNIKKRDEFVF